MAITIYDLAKEAHVSIATVSKALNNSYTISDQTRERIQTLARQMNYQPNARARSFARQKNGTVLFAADLARGVAFENPHLFEIIKGHKIELVVLLAAFYGLRRSEVIGLKWSAFDFNHDCVSIRHTVTTCSVKGERLTVRKDKAKNKSSLRTYPLIPFLKERLLEAKKQQEENRKLCGRAYNKEYLGYVCVDVIGNLIKPNYVSSTFGKLLAQNNMRHIRFHDLRHPYVKHTTKKYNSEKQKTQAIKMDLIAWVFRFCIFNYSKRSWIL